MLLRFQIDPHKTMAALRYLMSNGLPSFQALELLAKADREHLIRFGRPVTSTGDMGGAVEPPDMDQLSKSDLVHLLKVLEGDQPTTYEQAFPVGSGVLAEVTEDQQIREALEIT